MSVVRLLVLLALLLGAAGPARAAPPADLVRAELVPEVTAVRPGEPFTLGVRLVMRPGWHTYWLNPGDSGLPTEVAWTLPAGFAAGPIAWPAPARMPVADFVNFGYAGEAVLLVAVTPPAGLAPGAPVAIEAKVSYLVCERECIPGEARLRTELSVAGPGGGGTDPRRLGLFAAARARLPAPLPWPHETRIEGDAVRLTVSAPDLGPAPLEASFFPYDGALIDHAAPQAADLGAGGLTLTMRRAANAAETPPGLGGVLTLLRAGETRAYALGAELVPMASAAAPPAAPAGDAVALWQALLLALAGGVILNLMPCVFPVLAIKVLALVRGAGERRGLVRAHGLAYATGVLAAFLGLAGILIALRAGGAQVGWGYQLQSPVVVAALAGLLLAVGLSLSGVFQLGGGVAGLGDGLARRAGLQGSFFTGALAALVATPCTAPFMGVAVGFALTQPAVAGLAVFAALGLGLALPFLTLTLAPGLVAALPRPGRWMAVLKGALAFPVYGTVAWLVWVVSQQTGPAGLMAALAGLVLVGFAAWALGQAEGSGPAGRRAGLAGALVALATLAGPALVLQREAAPPARAVADEAGRYSDARLAGLRAEGRPVLVNLTASWCITCLVNERAALDSATVRAAIAERGVVVLRGDWTNQDPALTQVLARYGRAGVPLYLLVPPSGEPVVLPQILTPSRVVAAIEALPAGSARSADAQRR